MTVNKIASRNGSFVLETIHRVSLGFPLSRVGLRMQNAKLDMLCVSLVLWVSLLVFSPLESEAEDRVAKIDDLRERAVAVRSVDPADEDFSDLKPFAEAIGNARIVQLGESTHGSGATFAAKVRLIKFLHRELGFDVLLWESGMYDVRAVDESLRSGADPVASARLGIFGTWTWSQEVEPVFEYARRSHAEDQPLEMAGFDMQLSGRAVSDIEVYLLNLTSDLENASVRDAGTMLIRGFVERYRPLVAVETARLEYFRELQKAGASNEHIRNSVQEWEDTRQESFAPAPPDLQRFLAAADDLLEFLATHSSEISNIHGDREEGFMRRVVGNLREYGISQYERNFAGRPTEGLEALALRNRAWNRRDARMAENLEWLAEKMYPDRKLIVWAHSGHIMNAYYQPDWNALAHEPVEGGMKPMGAFVAERLGTAVYTVGFTAFSGEYGYATAPPNSGQHFEAPEHSLEALLHEVEHDYAFLDFRGLPNGHWLRKPATMAIRGYKPEKMEDWTKVVDGIFFTDRMTPATKIEWQ